MSTAISMLPGILIIQHKKGIPDDEQQLRKEQLKTYAYLPPSEYTDFACEKLIKSGVTILTSPLDPPLTKAAKFDRLEILQVYFAIKDKNYETLAIGFFSQDTQNIVKLVLEGWSFEEYRKNSLFNPAIILADDEITGILKELASFNANIRCRGLICGTLLHFIIQGNEKPLVRYLLKKGARVDARTTDNWTPLHMAAGWATAPIIKELLRHGADINATISGSDYDGATPLHVAILRSYLMDWRPRSGVLKCLIEQGASIDAHSVKGSVLELACEETLRYILSHHPDVNTPSMQEALRTALRKAHAACPSIQTCRIIYGATKVSSLYNKGVRLAPKDAKCTELLLGAVYCPELMKDLLKWGAGYYFNFYPKLSEETKYVLTNLLERAMSGLQMDSAKFILKLEDSDSTQFHDMSLKRAAFLSRNGYAMDILNSVGMCLDPNFYASLPTILEVIDFPNQRSSFEEVFTNHVLLLKALDLDCNVPFFQGALPVWVAEALNSPKLIEYNAQAAEMKAKKIVNISFHDFLNMTSGQAVSFLRNKSAVETLQGKKFARKFPDYFDIIKWRFDRAIFRRTLLDQGMKMFNFLYKNSPMNGLSFELKEKILDCLTNLDLYVLVNVCKLVE